MVLTRCKIFLSPFFSRYAGILSILYLMALRKWLCLELMMACLKRLMKLYAMMIKESQASVAQKSWEENLSAEKSYLISLILFSESALPDRWQLRWHRRRLRNAVAKPCAPRFHHKPHRTAPRPTCPMGRWRGQWTLRPWRLRSQHEMARRPRHRSCHQGKEKRFRHHLVQRNDPDYQAQGRKDATAGAMSGLCRSLPAGHRACGSCAP